MARDEISAEVARREAGTSSIADVFSGVVVPPAGAGHDVTRAWYAANGDIERAHTTGTFVREPRRGEAGPVLVVYVDSKARVTDFSANSEVYLARLANAGHPFCKVEFRLSRYPRRPPAPGGEKNVSPATATAAAAAARTFFLSSPSRFSRIFFKRAESSPDSAFSFRCPWFPMFFSSGIFSPAG